ncbi:MAG: GrpB family protein [Carbonactinosporaceae bacterium]
MSRERDLDAHLDRVLVGGRERRAIVISDYDAAWPERFTAERDRIAAALGSLARRIAHVGSTAVPGLAAKPVVDILVAVDDVEAEDAYRPPLERAGYRLRVREPGHRMFRTPERDVHVHLWPVGGDDERRQLLFRDRLRASPADRESYERVKRALARREWRDMNHYADAKGTVVAEIMGRAERWAGRTRWAPPRLTAQGQLPPSR